VDRGVILLIVIVVMALIGFFLYYRYLKTQTAIAQGLIFQMQ